LRAFAAAERPAPTGKCIAIEFDFFASPKAVIGENGRASAVEVERTRLENGRAVGTGETYTVPAGLVISCIGYQTSPIPDVPYDEHGGRFANEEGRIAPRLYCVGWARRGPSGTIGTNRPDGYGVIDLVAADLPEPAGRPGGEGFDRLAEARGLKVVRFRDWKKIEAAEVERARHDAPREKFVRLDHMFEAAGKT
jgi:ferredoxin--NADP+ reductase